MARISAYIYSLVSIYVCNSGAVTKSHFQMPPFDVISFFQEQGLDWCCSGTCGPASSWSPPWTATGLSSSRPTGAGWYVIFLILSCVVPVQVNNFLEYTMYSRVSWYWNQDHCQAGEGSFCCKSLQNMFKNVFGPLAASSQVYTFRVMQYIWVKNDFFTI
jgi:hypothetical protein